VEVEGAIVDGEGRFQVPFDLAPLPVNEPGNHSVHAKGRAPSQLGGLEWFSASTHYTVQPDCRDLKLPS
jgi:hypothetical protein